MMDLVTTGKYYTTMVNNKDANGNLKYSGELRECIEEAASMCLDNIEDNVDSPIMMLGNIQSGKTRAFIGLLALCFDNEFDMAIILTKCSKALVEQTVSRMAAEFISFKSGQASVSEVVAQNILDIDFSGCNSSQEKENILRQFLKRYKGKKRIIVVKKQADNVDRMNMFVQELVEQNVYRRLIIVDDEADITSIGYQKHKGEQDVSLRRISGAINTLRQQLSRNIEYALMQVTATPYALYLQPEYFNEHNIMPVKPRGTVVVPTGKGYIGGQYYFIDSQDPSAANYSKAKYLYSPEYSLVSQDEMEIVNGSKKNSGKNCSISDKRTVKLTNFITGQSVKSTFKMPALRDWIFRVLTGCAILQLNAGYEDTYISCVLHAATVKDLHQREGEIIEEAVSEIKDKLIRNIHDPDVMYFIEKAYDDLKLSVQEYNILTLPNLGDVLKKIAFIDSDGDLNGLIEEIGIKSVNSDRDISKLLDSATGELKLENAITVFVGGQVLDRGITIPNLISFYYGRDPKQLQQDTVMQHCRMFGYRSKELLSITRFYTTARLYEEMTEVTVRDNILRERISKNPNGNVIYLEAGGKVKACSPQKILASKINSILPENRYLPIGFTIDVANAKIACRKIEDRLNNLNAFMKSPNNTFKKGEPIDNKCIEITPDDAIDFLETAFSILVPEKDGKMVKFQDMETVFWFTIADRIIKSGKSIKLIVRRGRGISRFKNQSVYQDAPDDGNNEGALAKLLRQNSPVLVLIEETNIKEWKHNFWWPVFYTPYDMNVGIYAEQTAKTGVLENVNSATKVPMMITDFSVVNNCTAPQSFVDGIVSASVRAKDYFKNKFDIDCGARNAKMREITCEILIEEQDPSIGSEETDKIIRNNYSEVMKILRSNSINKNAEIINVQRYMSSLLEYHFDEELRNNAENELIELKLGKAKTLLINRLIQEIEETIRQSRETFGYFLPLGGGKCVIKIFYETIKNNNDFNGVKNVEKAITDFGNYVTAHEIYHALHYAEVMTVSGRWHIMRKNLLEQDAVKESMAEYFALCYAEEIVEKNSQSGFKLEEYIRDMRSFEIFPADGGYSGALIFDKDINTGINNAKYMSVYEESLSDMIKAYTKIKP